VKNQESMLLAGPWVGELGWELFAWQGFLRKLAIERKFERVVIACRSGHEYLYEDFATDFIPYNPKCENKTDMCHNYGELSSLKDFFQYWQQPHYESATVIPYNNYPQQWWLSESWQKRQLLIPYGDRHNTSKIPLILMIVRDTNKCNTSFRNWPVYSAQLFADYFGKHGIPVACIGKSDSAIHISGTIDKRDIPINELVHIMCKASVIVGPQSGPIHLASLCRLPQMCWQTKQEHSQRTKISWNPFNTPVMTLPAPSDDYWRERDMWTPPVNTIITSTLKMLHM